MWFFQFCLLQQTQVFQICCPERFRNFVKFNTHSADTGPFQASLIEACGSFRSEMKPECIREFVFLSCSCKPDVGLEEHHRSLRTQCRCVRALSRRMCCVPTRKNWISHAVRAHTHTCTRTREHTHTQPDISPRRHQLSEELSPCSQ